MSLHDEYLKIMQTANNFQEGLYKNYPENQIALMPTVEGIKIETRSPSGSGDIVHYIYLTKEQAVVVYDYIQKVFINKTEKKDA